MSFFPKGKEYSCSERQQLGWRPPLQPDSVPIALPWIEFTLLSFNLSLILVPSVI